MIKNSAGFSLPLHFSGISGLNVQTDGQWTCRSSHVKAGKPTSPANIECRFIDVEAVAPVGLVGVIAASIYDDARVSPPPILRGSTLAWTCSRIRRGHRDVVGVLIQLRPHRLPWWGLHHGDNPLRSASSTGGCCRLGRSWQASSR